MNNTAASSHRSAGCGVPAPSPMANRTTAPSPSAEATQNIAPGRSPARTTAAIAVNAGLTPMKIAACTEVTCSTARPKKSGNTTTVPPMTMASPGQVWRGGNGTRW